MHLKYLYSRLIIYVVDIFDLPPSAKKCCPFSTENAYGTVFFKLGLTELDRSTSV
jgi:hypothetical protein